MREQYTPILDFFPHNKSYRKRLNFLKEHFPLLLQAVDKADFARSLYKLVYELPDEPLCVACKTKPKKFRSFDEGYSDWCGHRCAVADPRTAIKRKQTNKSRYGHEYVLDVPHIRKKREDTMVLRFDVKHPLQNRELLKKSLDKHAARTPEQHTESDKKRKASIKQTYGVDSIWEVDSIVEKRIATNRVNLGVDYPQQNANVKLKSKTKRREKFFGKLDVRVPNSIPLFSEFNGINSNTKPILYDWQCKTCNFVFSDHIDDGSIPICSTCYPNLSGSSLGERQLENYLINLGVEYIRKDKTTIYPKELDFLIPSLNLAIEYCGLYYHSEKKVSKSYHYDKYTACKEKGIKLIQIFEDEWQQKRAICEARVRHFLKLNPKICGARDTTIRELANKDSIDFFNETHIQGHHNAKYTYGAYFEDRLIAAMSFGPERMIVGTKSQPNHYEMIRFSSVGNIPGIANKLFRFFVKQQNPDFVVSYSNLRWGTGEIYQKLGFQFLHISQPNPWYTRDGLTKFHRFKFSRQNLSKLGYSDTLHVDDITESLGYYKVYDCGSAKYIWRP